MTIGILFQFVYRTPRGVVHADIVGGDVGVLKELAFPLATGGLHRLVPQLASLLESAEVSVE